jgi:ABC-type proline/glycine betaine transport system permease subunit
MFSVVFLTIGGAFFLSAAQSAFNNQLIKQIAINLPDLDPVAALSIGATQIRSAFTPAQVPLVIDAYMTGLKAVFAITVAGYGVATLVGALGSWKRLHGEDLKKATGGAA